MAKRTTSSDGRAANSPLATTTVNGTTVKLYGDLRNGLSELQVQLLDKDNNPLEAGQVKLELTMDMPGMQMNEGYRYSFWVPRPLPG